MKETSLSKIFGSLKFSKSDIVQKIENKTIENLIIST